MKLIKIAAIFVITTLAFAQNNDYEIHLKQIWAEQSQTPGKQYFALLGDDAFFAYDRIMIYGKKDNKMRSRFISLGGRYLPLKNGDSREFQDDFYKIAITRIAEDTLTFKMTGQKPGFEYFLTYKKLNEKQFKKTQSIAWAPLIKEYKRLDKVAKIHTPKTIKQLKDIAKLLAGSDHYWYGEDALVPWQFEDTLDEIDSIIKVHPENSQIAKTKIKADASDLLSQTFTNNGQWTKEEDLPYQEELFNEFGYQAEKKHFFTYYHDLPKGNLKEGSLKRGLEKFLKVAIIRRSPWQCEGDFAWKAEYIWVLKDGSSIEYFSELECD